MQSNPQCLGWSGFFADQLESHELGLRPVRISADVGRVYTVLDLEGASFTLCANNATGLDRPSVGDWLLVRPEPHPTIIRRLKRRSGLVRQKAGRTSAPQIIAANLDTVFIVTAAGADFNPRRIDRYIAAVCGGGAEPVVVVNKADLALGNPGRFLRQLPPDVPAMVTSALLDIGIDALQRWLEPGQTVGFVGSSGVGKSTLVNALIGEDRMDTGDVRVRDERGQHTTTRRELLPLSGGALLMDTPGMRELGLWNGAGLAAAFAEIDALEAACRFRDCTHDNEPGCAVRAALETGRVNEGRLDNFRKLQRESDRHRGRREVVARRERRKREIASRRNTQMRDRKRAERAQRQDRRADE